MGDQQSSRPDAYAALKTAILFLVFNRPEPTRRVFSEIRRAEPQRLYIAADGPRPDRDGETDKVEEVRNIVSTVDWPCEVHTLYREQNLGCKYAVSSAIDWFFEHEEEGIILEDDCLPSQPFFWFCGSLLARYRNDHRIWQISGTTHFEDRVSMTSADYFLSRYGPVWGWASWRRAWRHYDVELSKWPSMSQPEVMRNVYPHTAERESKRRIGDRLTSNRLDTWDYQWAIQKAYQGALTILPRYNQVVNIGFGPDATHTVGQGGSMPSITRELPLKLAHPEFMVVDRAYDEHYADMMFRRPSLLSRIAGRARASMPPLKQPGSA